MATKIRLNRIRISFADDIWNAKKADENDDGPPKFHFEGVIPPNHPDVAKLEAAIDAEGQAFFKDNWKKIKAKLSSENRLALRKTPRTNQSGDVYDGYEDNYWVRASSKSRPLIANADKSLLTEADGVIYSGCFVNVVLEIFGNSHKKGGNRVLAQVKVVQYAGPGDAFGGGAPGSLDDLEDVSETAGAEEESLV